MNELEKETLTAVMDYRRAVLNLRQINKYNPDAITTAHQWIANAETRLGFYADQLLKQAETLNQN